MLKILIADDEPKVCKLVTKLVENSEVENEIVGIVYDGVSALEFFEGTEGRPSVDGYTYAGIYRIGTNKKR